MSGASVELLCMVGHDPPERLDSSAVTQATIDMPDAGPASALVHSESLQAGQRVRLGVVFGIVPHVFIDGVARSDGSGWRVEDILHTVCARPAVVPDAPLDQQLQAVFAPEAELGHRVEVVVDADADGVPAHAGQTLADWLRTVCDAHGLTLTRRAGSSAFQSVYRVAPLAMARCSMPPFTPQSVLTERRFSPAPGVRVAELRVVATTQQRGLIGRVHELSGFGADDGVYYVQHIGHHLQPAGYEQTLTLVRVGA